MVKRNKKSKKMKKTNKQENVKAQPKEVAAGAIVAVAATILPGVNRHIFNKQLQSPCFSSFLISSPYCDVDLYVKKKENVYSLPVKIL
ncbi:hypothetical protein Taro_016439 [Colocasia esculenta]|uniref:Uncharacterized protein n=1 Tax=Colocasia esculenta TaxID=4460 RepID=A0A843UQ61_COLES|nr:hypothetical protein [Colocasia esculenta]